MSKKSVTCAFKRPCAGRARPHNLPRLSPDHQRLPLGSLAGVEASHNRASLQLTDDLLHLRDEGHRAVCHRHFAWFGSAYCADF